MHSRLYSFRSIFFYYFFFFQAEDGIRDLTVTGVQTCALPISGVGARQLQAGHTALAGREPGPGDSRAQCRENDQPRKPPRARLEDPASGPAGGRSEEHTSELQSQSNLVCRLLLEKKKAYIASCPCCT